MILDQFKLDANVSLGTGAGQRRSPNQVVAQVVAEMGGLDILVNNASIIRRAPAIFERIPVGDNILKDPDQRPDVGWKPNLFLSIDPTHKVIPLVESQSGPFWG